MKKLLSLIVALTLCLAFTGCAASEEETAAPVTVATEASVETTAETQPPETVAETEAVPVAEMPADAYFKNPNITVGYQTGDRMLEVFDCRMYPMENGVTRFEVVYKTVAGLQPVVFAHLDDGDDQPDYWYEAENLTTEEESTLVFEMETEFLNQTFGPDVHFRNEFGFEESWVLIYHTEQAFKVTDGNPVGEITEFLTSTEGKVKVHSASMQALDNGYVRFTIDCTPQKNRYISFYNPPEGDRFMYITQETTSGQRETIMADVRAEDVDGLHNINLNFFNEDAPVARIYLNSPITNFNELDADQFAAFIGGNKQLALLYYGVIDKAVMGATLTAEDGTTVEVAKNIVDKNGDGHSLLWFKEYKSKKGDTVSITLSKEGFEDIVLELYVH